MMRKLLLLSILLTVLFVYPTFSEVIIDNEEKIFFVAPQTEPSSVEEVIYLEAYTKTLRDATGSCKLFYLYFFGKNREYYELSNINANLEFLLRGYFDRAKSDQNRRKIIYRDVVAYTDIINNMIRVVAIHFNNPEILKNSFQFFSTSDIEFFNKIRKVYLQD